MAKTPATEQPAGSPANPIELAKDKKLLQSYYAGKRMSSPLGGQLDIFGIREGEGKTGRVLLECNASSLRYVLIIPKATKTERAKVKAVLDEGGDATCPRHGPRQRLSKIGKDWVCTLCSVAFGKSG